MQHALPAGVEEAQGVEVGLEDASNAEQRTEMEEDPVAAPATAPAETTPQTAGSPRAAPAPAPPRAGLAEVSAPATGPCPELAVLAPVVANTDRETATRAAAPRGARGSTHAPVAPPTGPTGEPTLLVKWGRQGSGYPSKLQRVKHRWSPTGKSAFRDGLGAAGRPAFVPTRRRTPRAPSQRNLENGILCSPPKRGGPPRPLPTMLTSTFSPAAPPRILRTRAPRPVEDEDDDGHHPADHLSLTHGSTWTAWTW